MRCLIYAWITLLLISPAMIIALDDQTDVHEVVTCDDEEVQLKCGEGEVLLVREASFFEGRLCQGEPPPPPPPRPRHPDIAHGRRSLLNSVNRRCEGRPDCLYYMKRDRPNLWRPGILYISYTCQPGEVTRFCSETVTAGEGLLMNPGYPRYYPGDMNCSWMVHADEGRSVRVIIHDLNIRDRLKKRPCRDFLRISDVEEQRVLYMGCGDLDDPVEVTSRGSKVMVTLWATGQPVYLHRGALVQYLAVGCRTPTPPSEGYLVHRNTTHALFTCCVNFMFADTRLQERMLQCMGGGGWNDTMPETCVDTREQVGLLNSSKLLRFAPPNEYEDEEDYIELSGEEQDASGEPPSRPVLEEDQTVLVDMVIPISVLVALVIANAIVLFVIYRHRRRNKAAAKKSATPDEVEAGMCDV